MTCRVAIFIDGENFRYTLRDLFPSAPWKYLPTIDWQKFLNLMLDECRAVYDDDRLKLLRCYWYVIDELTFNSEFTRPEFQQLPMDDRLSYFRKHAKSKFGSHADGTLSTPVKAACADRCLKHLKDNLNEIRTREESWKRAQASIQHSTNRLQFQRFGFNFVDLDSLNFRGEKGVDVKLAIDLVTLKDTYDLAVLVSGDADYIPAVVAIKGLGKHVISIDFLKEDGHYLPGGARRLKEQTDFSVSLDYEKMKELFLFPSKARE
jgi:uncharacterized LabA/DUF88 family protein